jgi:hypothetical protein
MSPEGVRIRIDRLVLDGLPPGSTSPMIEAALRRALAERLAGVSPREDAAIPAVAVRGDGRSVETAANEVAASIADAAGARR